MANKLGIGIGVRIDDIKKVKSSLETQINGIKGIKVNIKDFNIDEATMSKKLQGKMNTLSKSLKLKISGIELDDANLNKLQTQLNKLSRNVTAKIGNVEISDKATGTLQAQLNKAMKGLVVKVGNVEFDVTKIDTLVNKTKQATQEAKQYKNIMGSSLNIGDGSKAFDTMQRKANEIRKTVDSLAKVSFNTNSNGQIDSATLTYTDNMGKLVRETMGWKQVAIDGGKTVQNIFTTLGTTVSEDVQKIQRFKSEVIAVKSALQGRLNTASALGVDPALIANLQTSINGINTRTPKEQLEALQLKINTLGTSGAENINKLQNAINSLTNRINGMKNTKQDIIDKKEITELETAENEVRKLHELLAQVKSGKIIDGKVISQEIGVARNSVDQLRTAINGASTSGMSLKSVMKNVLSYTMGGSAIYMGINQIREGLTAIKDVDTAMRDLRRVSDDVSKAMLDGFTAQANGMAKQLGNTTESVIQATATFKQLGYSWKESKDYMASQSIMLANVGDMSSKDSANAIVSTLKGFKLEASDTTKVVDSLNEAGNKFAVTTGDLAEGLRISSASMALANNDLYQTESLITAGTEVLRDANTVGNGLKTISMRLNQVKTAKGDTFFKLKKDLKDLANTDLTDVNGNLRSTYDVIMDLSKAWQSGKLSDMTKSKLLDETAGKQQAKVMASILQNAEKLPEIYDTLRNSNGSAEQEQARFMDSIEGKMNAFQETVKSLWLNSISSGAVKVFLASVTGVVSVFDVLIQKAGLLPSVLVGVATAMSLFNTKFREAMSLYQPTFFTGWITGLGNIKKGITEKIVAQKAEVLATKEMILASQQAGVSTKGMTGNLLMAQLGLASLTVQEIACTVATTALQIAFTMGLSLAITGAIAGLSALGGWLLSTGNSMTDTTEQANKLSESLKVKDNTTELFDKYKGLKESLKDANLEEAKRKEINDQLLSVKNDLISLDDGYKWVLQDQNKTYDEQLTLLQNIYEAKLKANAKELDSKMDSQGKAESLMNGDWMNPGGGLTKDIALYKQIQDALANPDKDGKVTYGNFTISAEEAEKTAKSLKDSIKDAYTQIETYNHDVEELQKANYKTSRTMIDLGKDTKDFVSELTNAGKAPTGLSSNIKTAISAINELDTRNKVSTTTVKNLAKAFPDLGINANNASAKIQDLHKSLNKSTNGFTQAQKEFRETGTVSQETVDKLATAFPKLGINADNAGDTINALGDTMSGLADNADDSGNAIAKATENYSDATAVIAKTQGYLDKINKAKAITPTLAGQMTKYYGDDIVGKINNITDAQKFLNDTIKEQQAIQQENYEVMIGDDENFYKEKIANNSEYQSAYTNLLNSMLADGQDAYTIDFGNYKTLNALKNGTLDDLGVSVATWLAQFVGTSADGYADDFSNFKSFADAKGKILQRLADDLDIINKQITDAQDSARKYNDILANGQTNEAGISYDADGKPKTELTLSEASARASANEVYADTLKGKKDKMEKAKTIINTNFDEFSGKTQGFGGGKIGTSDFSGTGGGKDSDGKKAADEAKKYAEEIAKMKSDVKLDVYFELNNAIKNVDNELNVNKELMSNLTEGTVEYQKAQEAQIALEQKKQVALENLNKEQKNQAKILRDYLTQYGFTMDEMGNLTNSQTQIQYWQDITNAMGGDTEEAKAKKQEWIDWIKELEDKTKDYSDLVNDKIPDVTAQWKELGDQIRKTAKEQLGSLRDELEGALSKDYEKKKDAKMDKIDEAYDKKKKRLEKEYADDKENLQAEKEAEVQDYQDEIDALQEQLDDLNDDSTEKKEKLAKLKSELAKWNLDDSVFADNKRKTLTKEIADLEKDINKDSLQDQIDSLNKKKEASSDAKDKELKSLEDSNKDELDEAEEYYNKQKKKYEDYYEKKLKDENLYAEADKLLKGNQQEEILTLLSTYSEKYKDVGTLLGENFKEGFKAQIEQAMKDMKTLTGGADVGSGSSSGGSSSGSGEIKVGSTVKVSNLSSDAIANVDNGSAIDLKSGGTWGSYVDSGSKLKTVGYDNGYFQIAQDGQVLGWARREDLAEYETGGRTPTNIGSDGAIAKVHSGEKILNKEDTIMTDRIFQYVNQTMGLLNNVNGILSKYNPSDSLATYAPSVSPNISNLTTSHNNNSNVSLQNTINVTNNTKDDSYFNAKSLDRLWKNQTSRFS